MVTGASFILTSNASTPVEVARLPADLRFEKQITILRRQEDGRHDGFAVFE
jgi:hypothetical protein